ncbi:hypothetical protein [Saccharothrix deserti]|uniref:hypothetical protein n=1 Tax=Saccharothrix deserti TaxID=2593674 RepID=UPI00131E6551|nr:hypothetical protein [Saccharothrix deserti]
MRTAPPVPAGFGFPLGVALGVAATLVSVGVGATRTPTVSLVAMAAVVDVIAMVTTVRATLATAAVCWALHAGFVLGRHGELALVPRSGHAALVLALCAFTALGFASTLRAVRALLHEREQPRIPGPREGEVGSPTFVTSPGTTVVRPGSGARAHGAADQA